MALTLNLPPDIERAYLDAATAKGVALDLLVAEVLITNLPEVSGLVEEDGLIVYKTGAPLPPAYLEDALRSSREERHRQILGNIE